MRVLITGGAGFIGSNLIHYILKHRPDWEVVNLDALTYAGNLENLKGVEDNPAYRFIHADITDAEAMARVFDDVTPDAVMHLAAESHVDRSVHGAQIFVTTNVLGTQILLDQFRRVNPEGRFLQVSTDEVYGSLGPEGYFTESTPLAPSSPYSASKTSADLLVGAARHTHGMDTVITRCSNNYGPYQFPEKLIPLMIANALAGKKLPIYGDGMNIRDWLYVEDHCRALVLVLEKGGAGETYNIGGHNEWANLHIVKLILQRLGASEDLIQFVTDRPGHDRRYAIDASKIENELGWTPRYTFEEALPRTIEWYKQNQDWVQRILSGQYQQYYEDMYGKRLADK